MYMQEALELVCRKRKLASPKDYALLLADMSIIIPLDRTVASLQGKRELVLVKRSMLDQMGGTTLKATGKTTDPNGEILIHQLLWPRVDLIWNFDSQHRSLTGCQTRPKSSFRRLWITRLLIRYV